MNKSILYGIISAVVFFIVTLFILVPIGMSVIPGDAFTLSYHMFSYMGIVALCGTIITCTIIIVKKFDVLIEELKKHK